MDLIFYFFFAILLQVDDVVGDLAGGRYYSRESVVAVSLGMTTSVAYTESAKEVQKLHSPLPKSGEMVLILDFSFFLRILSCHVLSLKA